LLSLIGISWSKKHKALPN